MVCIHGPPGVGKLTVGQELEKLTGYLLIHDHLTIETAAAVFPFGEQGFAELRSTLFSALLDAACTTQRGIVVTHADDVFWTPAFAQIVSACCKKHGYGQIRVLLQCARKEHERRISDPARANYQKITDIARLDKLIRAGEFERAPVTAFDIVVDTTRRRPPDIAADIAQSLGIMQKRAVAAV